MKFVFLYTEIAGYFLACCNKLSQYGEVHIIRWPVNKEAPFELESTNQVKIYSKNDYNLAELNDLIGNIQPTVIVCSGWIDKDYLRIIKNWFCKIPTVMTCDTHWNGSLKQRLATVISRFTLLRIFSHAWVPGSVQKKYVLELGFSPKKIISGFYSCDLNYFNSVYRNQQEEKEKLFPKKFIYVGRYYDFKGVNEMWQAFVELKQEHPNVWELWCLGVGDVTPIEHRDIKHFGFVQPADLLNYTAQTGVFILPSRFEPWGVVVHEFAASGFPLLVSNKVGAKELFVEEGRNGFTFSAESKTEIKTRMLHFISLPNAELNAMGKHSHELAQHISPEKWTQNLLSVLKN